MEKIALINSWIFRILRHVKSNRGYQNQMCQNGHLSHHHFSQENPVYKIAKVDSNFTLKQLNKLIS